MEWGGETWMTTMQSLQSPVQWRAARADFVVAFLFNRDLLVREKAVKRARLEDRSDPAPREKEPPCIEWDEPVGPTRIAVCADSKCCASWLNGAFACRGKTYQQMFSYLQNTLAQEQRAGHVTPSWSGGEWTTHVHREFNTIADELANRCLDLDRDVVEISHRAQEPWPWLMAHCDGASRGNPGDASFGWVVKGCKGPQEPWQVLAQVGLRLGRASAIQAEASAMSHCVHGVLQLAKQSLKQEEVKILPMFAPWAW